MQIPSPNEGKAPTAYRGKQALFFDKSHQEITTEYIPIDKRDPLRGLQAVEKIITVPENPEIIDLATGQSNSKYWKPEPVLSPEGCDHHFVITDVGKREVECTKCTLPTSFSVPESFREDAGRAFFTYHKKEYEIFKE